MLREAEENSSGVGRKHIRSVIFGLRCKIGFLQADQEERANPSRRNKAAVRVF